MIYFGRCWRERQSGCWFPFNCLFIGKWFTKIGKKHPLSILLYLAVYDAFLYPENRSWYIFLCLFALHLFNKKTKLTVSLFCSPCIWALINTLPHVHCGLWCAPFLDFCPYCGWGITFLPYYLVSSLFIFSSRRSLSSDLWGSFRCQILSSFTGDICSSLYYNWQRVGRECVYNFMSEC